MITGAHCVGGRCTAGNVQYEVSNRRSMARNTPNRQLRSRRDLAVDGLEHRCFRRVGEFHGRQFGSNCFDIAYAYDDQAAESVGESCNVCGEGPLRFVGRVSLLLEVEIYVFSNAGVHDPLQGCFSQPVSGSPKESLNARMCHYRQCGTTTTLLGAETPTGASALWDRVVVRSFVAAAVVGAVCLAVAPMTKWEQEQAAGNTWAVSVGESPSRRPPVAELMRSQKAPASVYDPTVLRAAGRRLLVSVVLLVVATVVAIADRTRHRR
jgi:hypothetical protein